MSHRRQSKLATFASRPYVKVVRSPVEDLGDGWLMWREHTVPRKRYVATAASVIVQERSATPASTVDEAPGGPSKTSPVLKNA